MLSNRTYRIVDPAFSTNLTTISRSTKLTDSYFICQHDIPVKQDVSYFTVLVHEQV